jgi:hypothetical protein
MNYAQTLNAGSVWQKEESLLQRYVFPAYLAFSVCFYSMRFVFGWGSAETSVFESDMPPYLAAIKDVVWVGLLAASINSNALDRAVAQAKKHSAIYLILAAFCAWMTLCSVVHLFLFGEPAGDSLLYNIRKPLEYVPAALLAPAFIGDWSRIGALWKRLNWIALLFALYELVAVLIGWKQTAFGWGGLSIRFGGILGSANDWGIYSGCAITAILVLRMDRWQLVGFVPALVLSQSRSAIVGLLAALATMLYRHDLRRIMLLSAIGVLLVAFGLSFVFPIDLISDLVPGHAGLDESAVSRFDELTHFQTDFRDLDDFGALLFGVRYFHIEPFYLALMIRGGFPALILFVAAISMSLVRGWKLRKSSLLHLIALSVVTLISTASLFIPYPDVYPTNFYLWLAVGVLWTEPCAQPSISSD